MFGGTLNLAQFNSIQFGLVSQFGRLWLVEQDDGGQRSINIPADQSPPPRPADADTDGTSTVDQLRTCLRSLDQMKARFDDERSQWNAERDRLRATANEVGLHVGRTA